MTSQILVSCTSIALGDQVGLAGRVSPSILSGTMMSGYSETLSSSIPHRSMKWYVLHFITHNTMLIALEEKGVSGSQSVCTLSNSLQTFVICHAFALPLLLGKRESLFSICLTYRDKTVLLSFSSCLQPMNVADLI